MKATDTFKGTIEVYLNTKAFEDLVFKARYDLKTKNIDDCIQYILSEVKKNGANGFADQEIYDMAEYYYNNDKVDIGTKQGGKVVVNHKVEKPTTTTKKTPKKKVEPEMKVVKNLTAQTNLFDL